MKLRLQFSPALTTALLCAAVWYSLWLAAFRPVSQRPEEVAARPSVTHLATGGETLREILRPDRFALPSQQGFSGIFPEPSVNLSLNLEKPAKSAGFLELEHAPAATAPGAGTGIKDIDLPIPEISPEEK